MVSTALSLAAPAALTISTNSLVAAFLEGRKATTLATYRQGLEDFRVFVNAKDVDAAAALLLGRGHGEANRLGLAYRRTWWAASWPPIR